MTEFSRPGPARPGAVAGGGASYDEAFLAAGLVTGGTMLLVPLLPRAR
jgi:hypothetical protein